jgi:hypothetical protein
MVGHQDGLDGAFCEVGARSSGRFIRLGNGSGSDVARQHPRPSSEDDLLPFFEELVNFDFGHPVHNEVLGDPPSDLG